MATFLLRADDAEMAAWKADAERFGRSFADHCRESLRAAGRPVEPAQVIRVPADDLDRIVHVDTPQPTADPVADIRQSVDRAMKVGPGPSPRRVRTSICPHRCRPDQHCSRCD